MTAGELLARVSQMSAQPLSWRSAPMQALDISRVKPDQAADFYNRAMMNPQDWSQRIKQLQDAGITTQDQQDEFNQLRNLQQQQQRLAAAPAASQQYWGQALTSPQVFDTAQVFGTTLNSTPTF